jgi:hypothetical protein
MAAGPDGQQLALLHDLDPEQLLDESSHPLLAASMYAAHKAKQQAAQQPGPPGVYLKLQWCPAIACQWRSSGPAAFCREQRQQWMYAALAAVGKTREISTLPCDRAASTLKAWVSCGAGCVLCAR